MYGLVKFAGNLSKEVTHALTNLEQQCSMNVIDLQQKHTELLQEKKNLQLIKETVLKGNKKKFQKNVAVSKKKKYLQRKLLKK